MTKQTTPHTQTQQNVNPQQTDLEPEQAGWESATGVGQNVDGAQTGTDRSPRRTPGRETQHTSEPAPAAYEGSVDTRTPKRPVQGITSRSSAEESARQEKVVKERPDAQAGVNHSKTGTR